MQVERNDLNEFWSNVLLIVVNVRWFLAKIETSL